MVEAAPVLTGTDSVGAVADAPVPVEDVRRVLDGTMPVGATMVVLEADIQPVGLTAPPVGMTVWLAEAIGYMAVGAE